MQSAQNNRQILGILGGGQLGRMLIQEAISYDQDIYVLDQDKNAPCATLATRFFQGSFKDFETVVQFGRMVDVLTIEIEQVNIEALEQLEKEGKEVFPQSSVIKLIQDKGAQKQFYFDHHIPTSRFKLINGKEEISHLDASWFPCFVKSRKDGYDGKGVQYISTVSEKERGFDVASIVEPAVEIALEFSIIAASNGIDVKCYPLVDMEFDPQLNLVDMLSAPSQLPQPIQDQAQLIAEKIVALLDIRGLLAIEFFLTKDGEILVNEMAPRTHNSGHHTIEGNITSQFEQHLRAVLGWPLGDTSTLKPAVMVNLIGEKGYEGPVHLDGLSDVLSIPGVFVHMYGKKTTKPGRKMGHVTILADNYEEAHKNAHIVKEKLRVISGYGK
jgi:5-(carboxyamino)imidazole ribonucleotide synthase